MERHGDPALSRHKEVGLGLGLSNGLPPLVFPSHILEIWAHKSAGLGMTTGLAFRFEAGKNYLGSSRG